MLLIDIMHPVCVLSATHAHTHARTHTHTHTHLEPHVANFIASSSLTVLTYVSIIPASTHFSIVGLHKAKIIEFFYNWCIWFVPTAHNHICIHFDVYVWVLVACFLQIYKNCYKHNIIIILMYLAMSVFIRGVAVV